MKILKYLPAILAAVIAGSTLAISAYAEEAGSLTTDDLPVEAATEIQIETDDDTTELIVDSDEASEEDNEEETEKEEEPIAPGWYTSSNNKVYYYDEECNPYSGIQEIDGKTYYFAPSGIMKTGWFDIDGIRMYFDIETGVRNTGWIQYMDAVYYDDTELGKLTGIQEINGETYYFNEKGILYTGWFEYDGNKYYGGEDGAVRKGLCEIDGKPYLFSKNGKFQSGWQTIDGKRIFYDYDTAEIIQGWIHYNGLVYYSDEESGKYTGEYILDGLKYRFNEKGDLAVGLQKFDDGIRYYYKDGTPGKGFVNENGSVYYFDEYTCLMQTGFQAVDSNIYYFDTKSGKMLYGWQTISEKKYYFGTDGKMRTGLSIINNKIYCFDESGAMLTGWRTIDGKKYYFDNNGIAKTSLVTIDGKKYFFNDKGMMATGFRTINGNIYYFGDDGAAVTGWLTVNNKKYYFNKDCTAAIYRHEIDGKNYCFYSDGSMVTGGNQDMPAKALTQVGNVGGRPYWTWWGFNFRIEWCACFVSWCANQCGFTADGNFPKFISCAVGISWFKQHGQWKGRNYTPVSGDIIFFDWEPDGVADHVGIVDYYEDGYVYTIEGNSGDECRQRCYSINDNVIFGFAKPSYQP